MAERVLVLGGTRSGKSAIAEGMLAGASRVAYVATARPHDDPELAARVAAHRLRRPPMWRTVESHDLAAAIREAEPDESVLVDALGPWLAARMDDAALWAADGASTAALDARERAAVAAILREVDDFWDAAADHPGEAVVVVADESGLGPLPADASMRRWLDAAGDAVQRLAADADRVVLAIAGRAIDVPATPRFGSTPPPPVDLRAHGDTMVGEGMVDLAVNVHATVPPEHVRRAMEAAAAHAAGYPDDTATREALAARHGRDPSEILIAAGAAEVFWLLPRVARTRLAAIAHPAFTEPEAALRAAGVPVRHVQRDPRAGWHLDPGRVPEDADLVVLGNPNNPTGTLESPQTIAALCRPGRLVVVDEAFIDFVPDPAASVARRADLPGLVVVRSATKLWGLAGVRAGYAVAPAGLVRRCAEQRQPWPVGVHGLAALEVVAGDEAHRRRVADEVAARRADLLARLRAVTGVTAHDAAANFVLLHVPDGPRTAAALRERGLAVRTSTFPGLDVDHLRVAVRTPDVHARLAEALDQILHSQTGPPA